jgi:hypothetical protein
MKHVSPAVRTLKPSLLKVSALLLGTLMTAAAAAQSSNPFQGLQNALSKAVQSIKTPPQTPNPQSQSQPQPQSQSQSQTAQPQNSSSAPVAPTQVASTGTAAPWTPPGAGTISPAGPLDPAKLPDVGGIHIGAPSTEVPDILKKLHPGAAVQTLAGGPAPLLYGVSQNYQQSVNPFAGDSFTVNYTYEAGKPQAVYYLFRTVRYLEPVAKANLIDGLRKKYGNETLADMSGNRGPTTNDADIAEMYWLYDEQGHIVHPGNPDLGHLPYGCQGDYDANSVGSQYRDMIRDVAGVGLPGIQPLPAPTFCDTVIVLHMIIDGYEGNSTSLVKDTRTALLDKALLRRSAIAVGGAQKAQAQKQRQNEQNQANQAKPNL